MMPAPPLSASHRSAGPSPVTVSVSGVASPRAALPALVDVANCVVCRSAIAADRRARWPHVVTCSAGSAAEHQKELVRDGERRRRRRLKTEANK